MPFQIDAADDLLAKLRMARAFAPMTPQAVVLSAATGSGKTVIATAAIERVLRGDDENPPLEDAIFLWVTSDPELNSQTRYKMLATSDVVAPYMLIEIDGTWFDQERLTPGRVYFLNTQKLSRKANLVRRGDDRSWTFWDTINNTVAQSSDRFVLIIDEAHRGMQESTRDRNDAATIIQKFLKGSPGEIVHPVPLVVGISATPDRFLSLLHNSAAPQPRSLHQVNVPVDQIRESGLLKEVVLLHHPVETQPANLTMLQEAARNWLAYTSEWSSYTQKQHLPPVAPVLVVQCENERADGTVTATDLGGAINAVEEVIGALPDVAYAHAFGVAGDVQVGNRRIRKVAPSLIDGDPYVQIVFFKTSLNTGWDCPRAEVMMSFRTAHDATLIAQLVGRMVRTPLARRVDDNEHLNTVSLFLPMYDEAGLREVIANLTDPDPDTNPPVDITPPGELISLPRAAGTDAWFDALADLPSYTVPRNPKAKQTRRLMRLARLLAGDALIEDAINQATELLVDTLEAALVDGRSTPEFKSLVEDAETLAVKILAVGTDGTQTPFDALTIKVAAENIDDLFGQADRKVGQGLLKALWRRLVDHGAAPRPARLEAIAIAGDPNLIEHLDNLAAHRADTWLTEHRHRINRLSEAARQAYEPVRNTAREPVVTPMAYPSTVEVRVKEGDPTWPQHLYQQVDGLFPARFNSWERLVLEAALQEDGAVWLRNIDRKPWALAVPYEKEGGGYAPMFPDFLVLHNSGDEIDVDILDPHWWNRDDSAPKARGLARYADQHAHLYRSIQLIIFDGDNRKTIELTDSAQREKVRGVANSAHLKQIYDGL